MARLRDVLCDVNTFLDYLVLDKRRHLSILDRLDLEIIHPQPSKGVEITCRYLSLTRVLVLQLLCKQSPCLRCHSIILLRQPVLPRDLSTKLTNPRGCSGKSGGGIRGTNIDAISKSSCRFAALHHSL